MASQRIQRVNQLIKRELSQLLLREANFPKNTLVTITKVDTSSNFIEGRVFISAVPKKDIKKVLEILNRQVYDFQQKINRRLKMRPVPRIKFLEDKETAEAGRIEELLEELKKEEK